MKEKINETVVKHFYNLPKADAVTEDFRSVTICRLNESVTVSSSFPSEDILLLSNLALELLSKIKEEVK